MKAPQWVRLLVLAFAVMSAVGVIALVACAPAAPSSPSGSGGGSGGKKNPTEAPTLTPTPHPDCVTLTLPGIGTATSCPPEGPENVGANLRRHYNQHMEQKEALGGRRSVVEPVYIGMTVETTTLEAVDVVADFLEANGDGVVHRFKYGVDKPRVGVVVSGYVDIELMPSIAAIEGVKSVKKNSPAEPASSLVQPASGQTAVDLMGADEWHAVGVTGSGVEVAVIDRGFRDFRARILPRLSKPVKYLCFDAQGNAFDGQVPAPTLTSGGPPVPTPTPAFVACETTGGGDHGTQVSESLLEIAPDANLYVTNPSFGLDSVQYVQALDWLTAKQSDNMVDGVTVYDATSNDNFDVKVVNYSQSAPWDGPGDGTSLRDDLDNRSLLNIVDDAVERGVMWVSAAGNGAARTWFKEHPPFNNPTPAGIVFLDFRSVRYSHTGTGGECNTVHIVSGQRYRFQMRWDGPWEVAGADVDLELHLARGAGVDSHGVPFPAVMFSSIGDQSGMGAVPPYELLELMDGHGFLTGYYCLFVTKDSGNRDLNWLQVQVMHDPAVLGFSDRRGSISNPAESLNSGMASVGAARYDPSVPLPTPILVLEDYSARGPVPGSPGHVKPELLGVLTRAGVEGTSLTAPQVSGLVALVAQTFGSSIRPSYLAYILSANRGAINLAQLPSLEAPTNVRVSQGPCARRQLEVQFDHPSINLVPVLFDSRAVQSGVGGVSGAVFEGSGVGTVRVGIGTDRGAYDVTVRACARGGFCGPWSSPPTRFTTTSKVCKPQWFQAVPGDGKATLWWNPDPDATGYTVDSVQDSVSGEEHVIDGLTNGTSYSYRVQVLGPGGPSDWRGDSVRPQVSLNRPPKPTKLIVEENNSRRFPGVALKWEAPFGSYLYEIRVSGGGVASSVVGVASWERLPFQPIGWDSQYSARFFGGFEHTGDISDPPQAVGEAIIAGLIPGTEYHFAVRAAMERNSSEQLNYSPWSEPVTLKTLGVRPASAPGQVSAPALKAPPEGLVAVVNGTTVNLSWTAATNPNYVRQVVFRREAGVSPMQWTEIPVGLNDTTYTDTGLTSGITYRYRVRSYKQLVDGNYGESGHAEAVIP